jgi:hypothetical protein
MWWYIPIIPAFRRLKQEDLEFMGSWGYIARLCLKKPKIKISKLIVETCF